MTVKKVKYKLKGHGSFVIREGWLNKGLYYISEDRSLFREKKAADRLGVGNNMAQAIRYWLKACGIVEETSKEGAKLTNLGKIIYENDPYFEEIFTWWILHCNLVMNKELATTWYLFFYECEVDEYTREELTIQAKKKLEILIGNQSYSESSLKDDIVAITNMYAKESMENSDPEDNTISPFTTLGLLKEKNRQYTKVQPNLKDLDDYVVLYILLKQMMNKESVSIDSLQLTIGKVLNLSRVTLNQYLDRLENQNYICINRTAGLDVVYPQTEQKTILTALDVVKAYYNKLYD